MPTTATYTLSLHDALPISKSHLAKVPAHFVRKQTIATGERFVTPALAELERKVLAAERSEEHTSELQSQFHLVCRLLLEKKNVRREPISVVAVDRFPLPGV